MWSKEKLKKVVAEREAARGKLGSKVEQAALLYARSEGMTDEPDADRATARKELDALVDGMEPEDWDNLNHQLPVLGEAALQGLMGYSMRRALASVQSFAQEVAEMPDWPEPEKTEEQDQEQ